MAGDGAKRGRGRLVIIWVLELTAPQELLPLPLLNKDTAAGCKCRDRGGVARTVEDVE